MKLKICVMATVLVLTGTGLRAQGDRGIITGTVKDATGAVVPGARVTATHVATNTSYTASTTASGDFTVPALPVGNYQVRVENTGFRTEITNGIVVAAGATVRMDVALELGATQQTIEVAASAQIVQTEGMKGTFIVTGRNAETLRQSLLIAASLGRRNRADHACPEVIQAASIRCAAQTEMSNGLAQLILEGLAEVF